MPKAGGHGLWGTSGGAAKQKKRWDLTNFKEKMQDVTNDSKMNGKIHDS